MGLHTETGTALPALGPYRLRDYDQLPDEPRCELVFGRLHMTASPFSRHQIVSYVLGQLLGRVAEAAGGIVLQPPPDLVLADHSVVQPDLVYVSGPRLAIVRDRLEGAPDLVVEVLSPSTATYDRTDKQRLYAFSGVKEYWLVDHERRQIEFLIYEAGCFVATPPVTSKYRSPATPEIHLDLAELWRLVDAKWRLLPRRR
jgi:Uma2 family endonuclease